jgi:translation initiation factor IF-2
MNNITQSSSLQPKTAKRLAREAKIAKKLANQRSQSERQVEIDKIVEKLTELGIHMDLFPGLETIANDFVKTGASCNGRIKSPELEREFLYVFSNDKRIPISSMLKHITI